MSAQPIGVFSTTASAPLCDSWPNNACRALATMVTCTMHGFRHAPGSNHLNVSFLVMFKFASVINKCNLLSRDGANARPPLSGRQHDRPLLRCKDTANRAKKRKTPLFLSFFRGVPPFLRPFLASVPLLSPPFSGIGTPSFRRGWGEVYFSQSQYSEQPFTIRCLKSKR